MFRVVVQKGWRAIGRGWFLGGMLLVLSHPVLRAADAQSELTRANQTFSEDKFQEAAVLFDSLIKSRGGSPELYFNLGNALARAGDSGRAVLAYERGLLLNPRDAEIKANLGKVRQKEGLFEKVPALWEQPFLMLSIDAWAGLLLASAWLLALAFGAWALAGKKMGKGMVQILAATGFVFLLSGLLGLAGLLIHEAREDRAVVVAQNIALLISPFAGATASTSLKPGETIHAGEKHGEYIYIRNDEGKSGWVRERDIEKLR